jgi:hypothetical protein
MAMHTHRMRAYGETHGVASTRSASTGADLNARFARRVRKSGHGPQSRNKLPGAERERDVGLHAFAITKSVPVAQPEPVSHTVTFGGAFTGVARDPSRPVAAAPFGL